ncbi:MAG: protein TolQ [Desulfobacterota bacterium]|nr:protein TolQ [Thermodesulfobacteriota bacterium]
MWELILHAGPVAKCVLLILLLMSVVCWGIALFKYLALRAAIKESIEFLNLFWESSVLSRTYQEAKKLQQSPLAEIFRSGYMELERYKRPLRQTASDRVSSADDVDKAKLFGISSIKRALDQAATAELSRLEKNLGFLATTGSTAPFIGLFGTVWGIMDSFRQIGVRGSANLATVAPGISEALIATAFGLVAAIPAVVAYNYFMGKIKMISSEMDNFSAEFLNIIERHFEASKSYGHERRT